jgi:hypothetical protein
VHVYLSDRLFVALAKRLGVPRRRLATLKLRQQRQAQDGVSVSLFSLARLERWIDEKSSAHLLSCARRVIRKHPKYRRDLIEIRPNGRRRRRSSSCDDLPALDAHADALALSVESLFEVSAPAPVQVTPVQVTPVQVTPVQVTPVFVDDPAPEPIGYQAEPLQAQPISGAPVIDIASLLMGDPIHVDDSPVAKDALAEPLSRDLGADSSLFAVADWSAEEDFPDPFAVSHPFDSSEDPFAAAADDTLGPTADPFALAANGSLDTVGDPFAAAARQADAFGPMIDPFAASSAEIHGDPFSSTEDPFANSRPDPYASVGGDPFASKGAASDWRRESQEFDPFGA